MKRSTFVGARAIAICGLAVLLCFSPSIASAVYTTTFGVPNDFDEPTNWSVGDADSTYQEWNFKTALTGNAPDVPNPHGWSFSGSSYFSPGSPTHSAHGPFFNAGMGSFAGAVLSSTHNFYGLDIGIAVNPALPGGLANIFNYGTGNPGEGTHVIVQTGSTLDGDAIGNVVSSMRLVDITTGLPVLGGDNASATISQTNLHIGLPVTIPDQGPTLVDYEELKYEFFLPNYFGNFRVEWDQVYSSSIDTLRVDTFIGPSFAEVSAAPEPGTGLALLVALGSISWIRRRRQPSAA